MQMIKEYKVERMREIFYNCLSKYRWNDSPYVMLELIPLNWFYLFLISLAARPVVLFKIQCLMKVLITINVL